jgi:hypothetical protein
MDKARAVNATAIDGLGFENRPGNTNSSDTGAGTCAEGREPIMRIVTSGAGERQTCQPKAKRPASMPGVSGYREERYVCFFVYVRAIDVTRRRVAG